MTKQNEIPRWKQGQITKNVTIDTWECDNCGFTMDAMHSDAASDSEYTCPECELQECERDRKKSLRLAEQALQELRSEKETILEERIAVLNELEAAEQERDKLLVIVQGVYGAAINDISRWEGGMTVGTPVFQDRTFAKRLVRDLEPMLYPEGSKPDGE